MVFRGWGGWKKERPGDGRGMDLAQFLDIIYGHDEDTNDVTSNYHVLMRMMMILMMRMILLMRMILTMRMILMMKGNRVRRISGGQLGQLGGLQLVPQLKPRNGDLIFSRSSSSLLILSSSLLKFEHCDLIFIFVDHLCYNLNLNTAGADGDDGFGDGRLSQPRSKSSPCSL